MENQDTPSTRLRVCGYERSGNHLLMALIWANYDVGECGERVEVPNLRFMVEGNLSLSPFIRWAQLFGTHHKIEDLAHFEIDPRDVVYILRDPRDVMRSLWFMKYGNLLPENFVTKERLEDWQSHVQGYYDAGAIFVRYEDMVRDWESALLPIEDFGPKRRAASVPVSPELGDLYRRHDITVGFGPLEIGRVGWFGPVGPTAAAPMFTKSIEDRFPEILGDEVFGYQLKGLNLAR